MKRPRILIIDDDPALRKTLTDILDIKGYESAAAKDGAEGLALLNGLHVNLALIDLGLPDMSGLEVLRRIKDVSPTTDAIILTGHATLDSAVDATNRGAFSYLLKPCDIDLLMLNVQRAMERQRADEALRESEEKFRKIFELGPLGMAIANPEFRFVKVNEMLCRMLGYSAEELIGLRFTDITHAADWDTSIQWAEQLLAGETQCYMIEKRYITKSGEVLWGHLTVSMIRDGAGNPLYFLGMVEDVTERKTIESQLRHVQKMEVIGHLAGGVAHDFNNILTAIIGFSTLMEMKMDKENPFFDYLEQILAAADRGAHLTQGLLTFSRKQTINPQPINLNNIVRSLEKILPRLVGEEVTLQCRLAERNLIIMADPSQVDQILINLAVNAHDAMPDGGELTIETGLFEMTADYLIAHGYGTVGCYAMLTVIDTGTGMDEATRARIFEPFFTTKEVGKGTGLGLAIVYGIVKQHNGYVDVSSEPSKGTTFRIFLPLLEEELASLPLGELMQTAMGGSETLLVAEDNPEVRSITKMLLEEYGYRVIEAVDGEDAVAQFLKHKNAVKLVIMDVVMPKKSGKEAFCEIQRIRPDVKVIFTSGYTSLAVHRKGIHVEDMNFIPKPASPQALLKKVKEMLV